MRFVTFELDGARFGVPERDVVAISRAVLIAPLPRAPAIVEGVVDLHGAIVPVLDVRARFGLPPRALSASDHFVFVRAAAMAGPRALRVDRALDLIELDDIADVRDLPYVEHVAGVARSPDGLVLVHDVATFLSEAEQLALADALA